MGAEPPAEARDYDTWSQAMAGALAPLKCQIIQFTSDEAPGLLAYVAQHLGVHHAPDVFHVQHALSKAVAAPMGAKQRAAAKARTQTEERLTRRQAHRHHTTNELAKRGPGRSPKVAARLEPAERAVEAARHEHEQLMGQRKRVRQSIRAIGQAYHCVDVQRGVRRDRKLMAIDV